MKLNLLPIIALAQLAAHASAAVSALRSFAHAKHATAASPEDAGPEWTPVLGEAGYTLPSTVKGFEAPYAIDPKRCSTGYWKVECAQDTQMSQRRYYHKETEKEDRVKITPALCFEFCRNISGTQYFGLENGDRCYCTPFYHNTDKGGHGMCDMPCVGDTTKTCGGKEMQEIYQMHDCNNLPAVKCTKPPPPVQYALTYTSRYYRKAPQICSNAKIEGLNTVTNSICSVECEEGYYVLRNDLKCVEMGNRLVYSWGQIMGSAFCEPVSCGFPDSMRHARNAFTEVKFPNNVIYTCELGFSLNHKADGPKAQSIQCLSNQSFALRTPCVPVDCGVCPRQEQKYPHLVIENPDKNRHFGQRCNYQCNPGYTLNSRPDGDDRFSLLCMATGEYEEPPTCVPVRCGPTPEIPYSHTVQQHADDKEWYYPEKIDYECDTGFSLNKRFGGPVTFSQTCTESSYFTPEPAPKCERVLCDKPQPAPFAAYVDRDYVFEEVVTYTCNHGYSLTGKFGGETVHTSECGAEGKWLQPPPVCLPVECGAPPSIDNADVFGQAPQMVKFDSDPVAYKCHDGYSQKVNDNPFNRTEDTFTTSCMGNGDFSPYTACVNIDDCLVRNCGANGACKDEASPTGVPLDDYNCECQAGYEQTLHESELQLGEMRKLCTNINDCPTGEDVCGGRNADNSSRGICVDGLLGYSCTCGAGYSETAISGMPQNMTCTPNDCVQVPALGNATSEPEAAGTVPNYDTPKWKWTCDEGYSLTGVAGGSTEQDQWCLSTGLLSPRETCEPVSCGQPTSIKNADVDPVVPELFFKETLTYTCDEGYALLGDPNGVREFTVECLSGGGISYPNPEKDAEPVVPTPDPGPPQPDDDPAPKVDLLPEPLNCTRVICGTAPDHENADYNTTRQFVFEDELTVTCKPGYSWDRTAAPASAVIKYTCQSNGEFGLLTGTEPKTCMKIECEEPPTIEHTSHEPASKLYYGDIVTYTMDPGYTMPGLPDQGGTFSCTCGEDGEYDGTCAKNDIDVQPIDCGTAPTVDNANVTGETHYGGQLKAEAHVGYSEDGNPNGETECYFRCKSNGDFSLPCSFQRVTCNFCPDYQNVMTYHHMDATEESLLQNQSRKSGLIVRKRSTGTFSRSVETMTFKERRAARRSCIGKYLDRVKYECDDGYRVAPAPQGDSLEAVPLSFPMDFTVQCMEHGDYDMYTEGLSEDSACRPVTCDVEDQTDPNAKELPVLPNGPTRLQFMDKQRFTCKEGYSLDGTPTGDIFWKETCGSQGELSQMQQCHDIDYCIGNKCGEHGTCQDGELTYSCTCDFGYQIDLIDQSFQTCVQIDTCAINKGNDLCSPGGGDCVIGYPEYSCNCKEGYEARKIQAQASPLYLGSHLGANCPNKVAVATEPGVCQSYGQVGEQLSGGLVMCTVSLCKKGGQFAIAPEGSCGQTKVSSSLVYGMTPEHCTKIGLAAGPSGSGACKADFCVLGDGMYTPAAMGTCRAKVGRMTVDADTPTCMNLGGVHDVSRQGKCSLDLCNDTLYKTGAAGAETCQPVKCPKLPVKDNAVSKQQNSTIVFPMAATYTCMSGYTTDGLADGDTSFNIECQKDGTLKNTDTECQAIKCPEAPEVQRASLEIIGGESDEVQQTQLLQASGRRARKASVCFGQVLKYDCDEGYTVSGLKTGDKTFNVSCNALGQLSQVFECKPVSCAPAPTPLSTNAPSADTFTYGQVLDYSCQSGYSLDGTITGKTTFQVECQANGSATGIEPCTAITCGNFAGVQNAEAPTAQAFRYPSQFNVRCHSGYTVDQDPDGESTFTVGCGADGNYKNVSECKKVKCGVAQDTQGATSDGAEHVFQELATFTCKTGYSTDGTQQGGTTFQKQCGASGAYTAASPDDCMDIDFCQNQPCTTNGLCTDSGAGVVNPGYECACYEGYELRQGQNGPTCAADDCAGNPCGRGGTCTDLSENAPGLYGCECESGYLHVQQQSGPTCERVSCGVPKPVNNTDEVNGYKYTVKMHYEGEQPKEDTMTQQKILDSFDKATFTCSEGYSTDGSTSPEAKAFTVTCAASGLLSPQLHGNLECRPVTCDDVMLPTISNSFVTNWDDFFTYGQVAHHQCDEGHTLTGAVGAANTFELPCQADGTFGTPQDAVGGCSPITCNKVDKPFATPSRDSCLYGSHITYHCDIGHYLGGVLGATSFGGNCEADGNLAFGDPLSPNVQECEPVDCGAPDPQANVSTPIPDYVKALKYSEAAYLDCLPGYTVGGLPGGLTSYEITCGADGALTSSAVGRCLIERVSVSGRIYDGEDETVELAGVSVRFFRAVDEVLLASATTNSEGEYSTLMPKGDFEMRLELDSNWQKRSKNVTIVDTITVGQGADSPLFRVLPAEDWRIMLISMPMAGGQYLKPYMEFGCDLSQYVSSVQVNGASDRAGVTVSNAAYGPNGYMHDSYVRGAGNCTAMGCCLLKYYVEDVGSADENPWGSYTPYVEVYHGDEVVKTYMSVPSCIKDNSQKFWPVFTLDLSRGANLVEDGMWERSAYITSRASSTSGVSATSGTANWGVSFDSARWSLITPPSGSLGLIYGLDIEDRTLLHRLEAAHYYVVQNGDGFACQDISVAGRFVNEDWAECPVGYYLNGFYRTGTKFDGHDGFEQVSQIRCCKPTGMAATYGTCSEQDVNAGAGWSHCDPNADGVPTLMVGLKASLMPGTMPQAPTCSGEEARSGTTSSGVFIGGKYIELGFRTNNQIGKMGADNPRPAGFNGRQRGYWGTGMSANSAGIDTGRKDLKVDYFLPGCPEESFWVGFYTGSRQHLCRNCGQTVEDISFCKVAGTRTTAVVDGDLRVVQEVTLGLEDKFFRNKITLTNVGSQTLSRVRFMRSHDPDNTVDAGGSYVTTSTQEATIAQDGMAVVSSKSLLYDSYHRNSGGQQAVVVYYSDDPRARTSYGYWSLAPYNVYDSNVYDNVKTRGSSIDSDAYISIAFDVGALSPGESTEMVYYTALDSRPISDVVADVDNAAKPVLTLNKAKCCEMPPAAIVPGEEACEDIDA